MDYEKEYKAALERARQVHTTNVDENKKSTEYIFPELKESEDERIAENLKYLVENYMGTGKYFGIETRKYIAWLEKQGEQKPQGKTAFKAIKEEKVDNANKVESKFKVGDWVVKIDGKNFADGSKTVQITNIDGERHWFDCGTWLGAEDIRHWTIEDAKDGDILASKNTLCVLIFRDIGTSTDFSSHYNTIEMGDYGWDKTKFCPATKEQRKLLFQMINKEGYKWDTNNKQLIKL